MPYKLSGTRVVRSDTGEVVKNHPTREKALAHLRALKANVEEGDRPRPEVLGVLLEKFHADELRGRGGRWEAGGDRHGGFKVGDVVRFSTGSRNGGHGPVTMAQQPGLHTVVGLQRNGNLRVKHPDTGTTVDVPHQHAVKVSVNGELRAAKARIAQLEDLAGVPRRPEGDGHS